MTNNDMFQKFIDGQMKIMRDKALSESSQLLLGELKLKLDAIKDKGKPIVFDFGMKPAGASSWRGSYCELGLKYSEEGGGEANWDTDEVEYSSPYGDSYKEETFTLPENPTAQQFLDMLNALTGKTMTGYKGGDYTMHKNVAVYLGNYGESSVDNYNGKEWATVAPFDVIETEEGGSVIIITGEVDC